MRIILKYSTHLIVLTIILGFVFSFWATINLSQKIALKQTIEEAKNLNKSVATFRKLYTSEVITRLTETNVKITHDYKKEKGAIPLPATLSMHIGRELSDFKNGNWVKLYSPFPFPHRKETGGLRDDFAKRAWKMLNKNPNLPYFSIENSNGKEYVRYATADVIYPSCVNCHNNHPLTPKSNWKIGDVRGIVEVRELINPSLSWVNGEFYKSLMIIIIPFFFTTAILTFLVSKFKSNALELGLKSQELSSKTMKLSHTINDLNQISYAFSHDLKTPLNGINRIITYLKEDFGENIKGETIEYFDIIQSRTIRLNKILDRFRNYIKQGQTEIKLKTIDLNEILDSIIDNFKKTQKCEIEILDKLPQITSDKEKLCIVFKELLSNSINHNSSKQIKIEISSTEESNSKLIIKITDNSKGIPQKYHKKVFEPLQTLENKDDISGIGFGLTIVKKILDQLQGTVQFQMLDENKMETKLTLNKFPTP